MECCSSVSTLRLLDLQDDLGLDLLCPFLQNPSLLFWEFVKRWYGSAFRKPMTFGAVVVEASLVTVRGYRIVE